MFILRFHAKLDVIPSENYLYKPSFRGKKAFLYKDPRIKEYQENLIHKFSENFRNKSELPPKEIVKQIISVYTFGIHPDRYYSRDLTNMVKATEDALMGIQDCLLPYDDSLVTVALERKLPSSEDFISITLALLFNGEDEVDCLKQLITETYSQASED